MGQPEWFCPGDHRSPPAPCLPWAAHCRTEPALELKGYEVLEQNWSPEGSDESVSLIAYDDVLAFVDVTVRSGFEGFAPESQTDREAMEVLAAKYLAQTDDEPNFEVRFDIISMMVIDEDRAMLKHRINAFSEAA